MATSCAPSRPPSRSPQLPRPLIREHSYSTDTVKNLFRANSNRSARWQRKPLPRRHPRRLPRGRRQIREHRRRVPPRRAQLRRRQKLGRADEGLRLLQKDVTGRATFLVHSDDAQANRLPRRHGAKPRERPQPEGLVPYATASASATALADRSSHPAQAARRLHRARSRDRPQARPRSIHRPSSSRPPARSFTM